MTSTVTITTNQAQRLLQQLRVCADLLINNTDTHADLYRSLNVINLNQTPNVAEFINQLGHTRRYLDARITKEMITNKQTKINKSIYTDNLTTSTQRPACQTWSAPRSTCSTPGCIRLTADHD